MNEEKLTIYRHYSDIVEVLSWRERYRRSAVFSRFVEIDEKHS